MAVSSANKALCRKLVEVFGGTPRVRQFWDDNHESSVDILDCAGSPQPGVTSYATLGLSDYALTQNGKGHPARVEIVGACAGGDELAHALATAAFCVINSRWFCCPGAIFPAVLAMYKVSPTMKHILFVTPFLWEAGLPTLDLGEKKVSFLQAVPISEAELDFAEKHGPGDIEALFVRAQPDLFDLGRPSVV